MSKSIRLTIALGIVWLPFLTKAQISPEVTKKFPACIVVRIFEIASKAKLTTNKQMLLGAYFIKQDSLANVELAKGTDISAIDKYYINDQEHLKHILSPIELNDYMTTNIRSAPKFAVAIKNRESLNLTQKQIDNLFENLERLRGYRNDATFDIKLFEGTVLVKVLKMDQLNSLFTVINYDQALSYANADWLQLKKLNAVKNLDSTVIVNDFIRYQIQKMNNSDWSKIEGAGQITANTIPKPDLLIKVDTYNGKMNSQFADILKNRKELSLTNQQIDSLLNKAVSLEKLKVSNKAQQLYEFSNAKEFEGGSILKILNSNQYNAYLAVRVKLKAGAAANKDIENLRHFNLFQNRDSLNVSQEVFDYELRLLVASERLFNEKTQENAFNKKSLENNKPFILKQLDINLKKIAINNEAKKTLSW